MLKKGEPVVILEPSGLKGCTGEIEGRGNQQGSYRIKLDQEMEYADDGTIVRRVDVDAIWVEPAAKQARGRRR